MKKHVLFLILGLLLGTSVKGQIKIGDNPQTLDPSSVLELESNSRVFVITRVNDAQMQSITPLRGAMVYNTDTQCVHFYNGTEWINPCDQPDEQTFSADAIVNFAPTMIITENGTNFNFEVGQITGDNIVGTTVNGDFHLQDESVTTRKLADGLITLDKLADGTSAGELIRWNGTNWELIDETGLVVTEQDGIIGNEITDAADGTLVRSGTGIVGDEFLLDVSPLGITDAELANNAVTTNKILDANVTNAKLDKANIPISGFQAAAANIDLGNFQINNLLDPTLAQDAATKSYVDNVADDDITSASFDAPTNVLTINEGASFVTADLSDLDDSAGVTANTTAITANTTNITTNATDIANHIAADGDTDDENELSDLSLTLTTLELTNAATGATGVDLDATFATDAELLAATDDDITSASFNAPTNVLTINEGASFVTADLSDLDDSAGVTANTTAITANTTNITTNANAIAAIDVTVKPITSTGSDITLTNANYTVILNNSGSFSTGVTLPTAATAPLGKIFVIRNNSGGPVPIVGATVPTVSDASAVWVQNDGAIWQQIN
ncbi:hypothetical protein [Flagellimonas allohymeniacidonis]|uniref:Uncharacterized protein n=1 Tax=Flagellimonas allohymeniacidonis TaxID=2517819 RepID=A0A4Q8QAW1_9FLAO|nr:hypothetical protein [Allomuricauda hymeniacidonis]TAI46794.1 hypothetical protein EW142_08815 [Allomuricauda hymeniacidonis]